MAAKKTGVIIPIMDADIKDLASAMIDQHGPTAEEEAERRADACQERGDQTGCEAWWRVGAAIREVLGMKPTSKPN